MPKENWYEMASQYPIKGYLEEFYGLEFNGSNKALCPFHDDNKPTLSLKESDNYVYCFSCGNGGDAVSFVGLKERIKPLEAVKKVLLDNGVDVGEKINLSPEEQEARNEIIAQRNQEIAEEKAEKEAKKKADIEFAIKNMSLISHQYSSNFARALEENDREILDEIEKVFPKYFNLEPKTSAIGWDADNKTVVTLTQHPLGRTRNIKRRTMTKNFFNWDVSKKLYKWKGEDKWTGWKNAKAYPFGIQFQRSSDDRVVLCEGEKDTLNLLSVGVNALTLGGVTSKWEPFVEEFLKDKKVYIWFDHDLAGYSSSLERYYEIKDHVKSCQVVLFNKLQQNFPHKGDVSDYLAMYSIDNAEDVFNRLVFSSFVPHNELLHEIEDYYEDWKKYTKPTEFLTAVKQVEFKEINGEILKQARTVRGEKDNELTALSALQEQIGNSHNKKNIEMMLTTLMNGQPDHLAKELETLKKFINVKKTVLTAYRQVHIHDIAQEFIRMIIASGYMLAKYRGGLYLWTGAYYYKFKVYSKDDSEMSDFIFQKFFTQIELDFKKKTVDNAKKVVENVQGYAQSLEEWIDKSRRILTMQNGALMINSNGKYTFKYQSSKKDCAFNILDMHYDKEATAPKWQKFLNRVLPDQKDQDALMEFIGYCLMPSHRFEKFLLLYGETGANGKSVVLDVIKSFFGKENVSGLQLQNFQGHELDSLTGKIINIGSELDARADLKAQMSVLKSLVSPGDVVTINPKFEKGYELHAEEKPKVAFATNAIPKQGVDGGFFRRVLAFSFDQEIRDDEKIRDLVERFNDEKAGILNLALEGLTRLIKQGKFSMSPKRDSFMEKYRDDADPVRVYAKESLKRKEGVMVAKNYIYEHYKVWCADRGHHPAAQRTFFDKLKSASKDYQDKRTTIGKDELLPSNCWYVLNVGFSKNAIGEFKFKGGVRESAHCMLDMKNGVQFIEETSNDTLMSNGESNK